MILIHVYVIYTVIQMPLFIYVLSVSYIGCNRDNIRISVYIQMTSMIYYLGSNFVALHCLPC